MKPLGLYTHIPFCVRKCFYCDFVSYAARRDRIPAYIQALSREFSWYAARGLWEEYTPSTVYVGGGTPSLAIREILECFQTYRHVLRLESVAEATLEVNPGTVSLPLLQRLRQAGFNRLSIGVQSFHDAELQRLGRIHTAEDAFACVQAARQAGFTTLSLDLMFGLPASTMASWQQSLRQAIALEPSHLSIYNLTIEPDTPFGRQYQRGELPLPSDDEQLAMYEAGIAMLRQAGYDHYEISNFALPGCRSQHNLIYWRNEAYLGLGAGAHSYLEGRRYWNEPELDAYMAAALSLNARSATPPTVKGEERLDFDATIGETLMMNLRLLEGVDGAAFQQRFGRSLSSVYGDTITRLQQAGLVEVDADALRLTHQGLLFSNDVFQEFIHMNTHV